MKLLRSIIRPNLQKHWIGDLMFGFVRLLAGLLIVDFGDDKFGMPWTESSQNLNLFEVSAWFPEDVASFGGLFKMAPVFFAWMGAFSEAVGGCLLALGLGTRIASFLIMCTMLTAIFCEKWQQFIEWGSAWAILPALGFFYVAVFHLYTGSGRFGLDYLISKSFKS